MGGTIREKHREKKWNAMVYRCVYKKYSSVKNVKNSLNYIFNTAFNDNGRCWLIELQI